MASAAFPFGKKGKFSFGKYGHQEAKLTASHFIIFRDKVI